MGPRANELPAPAPMQAPPVPDAALDCQAGSDEFTVLETPGPMRSFSVQGYRARNIPLTRPEEPGVSQCIVVAWPPGHSNSAGLPSNVSARIHAAWFRAIENTVARVPPEHARTLRRVVIDNRPKEHGIAPFDRESPDDARDGHTLWLHEHLFTDPNHWAQGNHGAYWSYHVNHDGESFDRLAAEHDRFSPVILHELGHLVMYNLVNARAARLDTPPCARTCGDTASCAALPAALRERGCVSPYCMPFDFPGSTENWAEQYRFHYQSSATRALLGVANAGCRSLLLEQDRGHSPAWERGLPDMLEFRKSLWKSCGQRPCKAY